MMTALEALQTVQYVTVNGRRLAVVDAADWECLVEWLETVEDVDCAKEAIRTLRAAAGDRGQAGWLCWDDVKAELGVESSVGKQGGRGQRRSMTARYGR